MTKLMLALLLGASVCCAQAPQVPVTGSMGSGGVFPLIASPALVFTSDANHIMSYPEASGSSGVLMVTSSVSLTGTRSLTAPLMKGFAWTIKNATTGGQSITVIGATGSGVTIANGTSAFVYCDGANYLNAVSGANLTNLNGANLQSGTVPNAALSNSSMTVNGQNCVLGGSCTVSNGSILDSGALFLSGGNVTVTTSYALSGQIMLSRCALNGSGPIGFLYSANLTSSSFQIVSVNADLTLASNDNTKVCWAIVN